MSRLPDVGTDSSVLVVGYGLHGRAVVDALRARDIPVAVVDDSPSTEIVQAAATAGVELVVAPASDELDAVVRSASHLIPTPGLPTNHAVFAMAADADVAVGSEFDLAAQWDDRPLVAITGTNGKTTVTTVVTRMLQADGVVATMAGNMELPLVTAIDDSTTEVFVVEASSFRLGYSAGFSPHIGTWLNFAPDHLDVHGSLDSYELAKAKIWAHQRTDDVAIANNSDAAVMRHLPGRSTDLTFGPDKGDATVSDGAITLHGERVMSLEELPRRLSHDVENALAAALTATAAGASTRAVTETLVEFRGLPHRMELVARADGVAWFNDSKATTPHAVVAGVSGHESAVLIAGGRNKGVDLSGLGALAPKLRAVVAIGEAAPEVADVFRESVPVLDAESMRAAVCAASEAARSGDSVVLSPGCTSYDWYSDYGARGDDFARIVREKTGATLEEDR